MKTGRKIQHGAAVRGKKRPKEYTAWDHMIRRCHNPNYQNYKWYGARGISVCDRWRSYENFINDMGPAPSKGHSLDRVNNDGNYEPGNCKWSTQKEQANNMRRPKKSQSVKVRLTDGQIQGDAG
jgi:hypothetical protein